MRALALMRALARGGSSRSSRLLLLQELLTEVSHKDDNKTLGQKLWRLMVHALAWAICIGGTTASVFAIYHFSEHMHRVGPEAAFTLSFLQFGSLMASQIRRQYTQNDATLTAD